MLTLPVKIRRKKQPYLAIRSRLFRRQVMKQAQLFFPEIRNFMEATGVSKAGAPFLRYNTVSWDNELDIEFGYLTDKLYSGAGPIRGGFLPAGSFMSVKWFGTPTRLLDVHAMFMGWAQLTGVEWDSTPTEAGSFFTCRVDILHRSPRIEPDPELQETELLVMLKGGGAES